MSGNLVIIGDSAFAEVAHEYFTHDSAWNVAGFAVERAFLQRQSLFGKPVVAFETMEREFPPESHAFYAALVYTQQNRLRERLYAAAKEKGYTPASFVSSHAVVAPSAKLGEHCFVFEQNVVQPFAEVGDNVVLWSGNHIGHHSRVGSHSFISSHVVLSGFVNVGDHAFFGVNSAVANNVTIGSRCLVGAGALVLGDVPDGRVIAGIWKKGTA